MHHSSWVHLPWSHLASRRASQRPWSWLVAKDKSWLVRAFYLVEQQLGDSCWCLLVLGWEGSLVGQ